MLFLLALAISILFVCFLDKALKSHPYPFYIGAALVTIIIFLCDFSAAPEWVNKWIIGLFSKGAMGTALFVIVMYAGALENGTKRIGKLMRIRGELSIFAAILVLAHNLTYGKVYFKYLFQRPEALSSTQLTAAIISIILITLMVILTVTSFPQIRKKMNPKSWKKLQRSAYVFYGLIYVHILLINIPYAKRGMTEYIFNVAVYSIIFVTYGVKRIRKYLLIKNKNRIKENAGIEKKINISAVIINVFVVICVAVFALPPKKDNNTMHTYKSAEKDTLDNEERTSFDNKDNGESKADKENDSTKENTTDNEENKTSEPAATADEENTKQENITKAPDESTSQNTQQPENQPQQTSGVQANNENSQQNNENLQSSDAARPSSTQTEKTDTPQETTTIKEPDTTTVKRVYKDDGEYTGRATVDDFAYDVSVTITIKNDKISNVVIKTFEEFFEDEEYAYKAASGLKSKLLSNQGTDGIDAVSGATYTSKAIFKAFDSGLESAKN